MLSEHLIRFCQVFSFGGRWSRFCSCNGGLRLNELIDDFDLFNLFSALRLYFFFCRFDFLDQVAIAGWWGGSLRLFFFLSCCSKRGGLLALHFFNELFKNLL